MVNLEALVNTRVKVGDDLGTVIAATTWKQFRPDGPDMEEVKVRFDSGEEDVVPIDWLEPVTE